MLVVYCPGFPSEKFSWDFSAILCLFLRPFYGCTHICCENKHKLAVWAFYACFGHRKKNAYFLNYIIHWPQPSFLSTFRTLSESVIRTTRHLPVDTSTEIVLENTSVFFGFAGLVNDWISSGNSGFLLIVLHTDSRNGRRPIRGPHQGEADRLSFADGAIVSDLHHPVPPSLEFVAYRNNRHSVFLLSKLFLDLLQMAGGNSSQFEKREDAKLPGDPAQLPDRPEMKVV